MECREITEGSTTFTAPVQDETTQFPPGSAPVFYNTKMEFNRDMTVLLTKIVQPEDYLDAMAATGVRGLRIANEAKIPVTINDRDEQAVKIIRFNAEKLGGDISVTCDDANRLMCTARFDSIDLDPFGTPIPFLDAASRAAKHYLFVTATDTAPLCGAHFKAGCRRYFATPRNTEYHAEVGLRMMMGTMARELVKYDRGMKPILSFAKSHYFRSHVRVLGKVTAADETIAQIGFVMQCPKCLYRAEQKGFLYPKTHICPHCGVETIPVGPLWMGPLQEKEVLAEMQTALTDMQFGTKRQMEKMLTFLLAEPDTCTYYDYHIISRNMKVSPPNMEELIASLNEAGYYTTRTHFCDTGIKTTAPLPLIEEEIRLWNAKNLQM